MMKMTPELRKALANDGWGLLADYLVAMEARVAALEAIAPPPEGPEPGSGPGGKAKAA